MVIKKSSKDKDNSSVSCKKFFMTPTYTMRILLICLLVYLCYLIVNLFGIYELDRDEKIAYLNMPYESMMSQEKTSVGNERNSIDIEKISEKDLRRFHETERNLKRNGSKLLQKKENVNKSLPWRGYRAPQMSRLYSSFDSMANYSSIRLNGANGQPFNVDREKLSPDEQRIYDEGWENHAFNIYASDRVPLNRTLPDVCLEG